MHARHVDKSKFGNELAIMEWMSVQRTGGIRMKIIIVRHGDPDYSIDSLTEKGWKEAEFNLAGAELKVAVVNGLGNARKLIEAIKRGEKKYNVEIKSKAEI